MPICLIVLQGPSASGKSTIQSRLGIPRIVTWTSRPPREGETDGIDYHFKSRSEMERLYELGQMLEMTEYHGNLYGTPLKLIEETVRDSEMRSMILDGAGARKVKAMFHDSVLLIGIKASMEDCEKRLSMRGHGTDEIRKRLSSFDREIAELSHCDVLLNNTDDNKGKIDALADFIRDGLGKYFGTLR